MSSMHSRRLWVYSLQGASPKNGEHNETRQRRHGALLTSPKQIGGAGFCSYPDSPSKGQFVNRPEAAISNQALLTHSCLIRWKFHVYFRVLDLRLIVQRCKHRYIVTPT